MDVSMLLAKSQDELESTLKSTDITVPARVDGRKSRDTEKWAICRLLSTLLHYHKIDYPIGVVHRDKPDFFVSMMGSEIGIESTEAIRADYAQCITIRDREFPNSPIDLGRFRWNNPVLSLAEMREMLREGQMNSFPWMGVSAEIDWCNYMKEILVAKTSKLNTSYKIYQQNWLMIYDNLPLPFIDI